MFSSRNSTGWSLFALMPPTRAAAKITIAGFSCAKNSSTDPALVRSSWARSRVTRLAKTVLPRFPAQQGAADEPAMAGDEDFVGFRTNRSDNRGLPFLLLRCAIPCPRERRVHGSKSRKLQAVYWQKIRPRRKRVSAPCRAHGNDTKLTSQITAARPGRIFAMSPWRRETPSRAGQKQRLFARADSLSRR